MRMIKEWFIKIEGKEQGPFSKEELKKDLRITPDTLVKKKDWLFWVPIGQLPELVEIFKEEEEERKKEKEEKQEILPDQTLAVLAQQLEPGRPFLWLFIILIIVLYVLYRLYS